MLRVVVRAFQVSRCDLALKGIAKAGSSKPSKTCHACVIPRQHQMSFPKMPMSVDDEVFPFPPFDVEKALADIRKKGSHKTAIRSAARA